MDQGLHLEVRNDAIHVAQPDTSLAVTFFANNGSGYLEASDFLANPSPSREELFFMATAWKLAYAKAQALGWLRTIAVDCV
jgi:hypothetical protein